MRTVAVLIVATALAVQLAACRTATMVVPAALAAVAPLPVSGLNPRATNQPIAFGPWRATVREGWQTTQSVEFLGVGVGKALRPYRFELAGGGAATSAACAAAAAEVWRGAFSAELPVEAVLGCSLKVGGTTWELHLDPGRNGALIGTLRVPHSGRVLDIRSVHALAGAAWKVGEPVGYELRRDGAPIAAAETINAGRVWLAASLDPAERDVVAAALTALLFFTPLDVQ